MKIFLSGQIKEEYRGNLAAVASKEKGKENYAAFLYDINSGEFTHLTGARSVQHPLERVYVGISHKGGELVTIENDSLRQGLIQLEDIDKKLVIPYFLNQNI